MQLSDSETYLLLLRSAWLLLLKKELNTKLQFVRHTEAQFFPPERSAPISNPGRLHFLYLRTCNLNYLSLQNQKIGSMKKPAITLKQPGISNVMCYWVRLQQSAFGFSFSVFYLYSILKGQLLSMPFWSNAWPPEVLRGLNELIFISWFHFKKSLCHY